MKKVILILGILFFLLISAVIGVLLYANHYVQSPAFKERLVAEISKVTGGTVQIDTINVSLTSRVEVGGIKLDRSDQKTGSQVFSTKKFLVKFNLWGLLHKRIEIEELKLDSPDIKIVSAPTPPPPAAPPETITPGTPPLTPSEAPSPSGQLPGTERAQARAMPETAQPGTAAKPSIDLVIRKAEVSNGKLDITLPDGKRLLLENFDLKSIFQETSGPLQFRGDATCESATFDGHPPLTALKATFRFDKDTLFLEKANATAFRGAVEVNGQVKISGNRPFTFHLKASNLDLKAFLEEKPELAQAMEGDANANVDVEGNFENLLDMTGKGFAEVKDGHITTKPIQFLMFTYQIPELQVITLTKWETDFTLGGRKMQVSRYEAISQDVRLDATGWFDLEQNTMDLNLHLAISDAVKGRLPPGISAGLQPEPNGFSGIAFREWGPRDNPQNDLKSKFAEGVVDNFLTTQVPQNIINNTFDKLEGMIKNPANGTTNTPSILENILGTAANPPPTTNSAPADAVPPPSTNSAPEKELLKKLKKLF